MTMNNFSNYGHGFQIKVMYALLNDKAFLQKIADMLTPDYFESPAHKWVVNMVIKYFENYNITPTMEVVNVELKKEKNEVLKVSIKEELKQAYTCSIEDIEYIKDEFFHFCNNQQMKNALMTSVDLLATGDFEGIFRLMKGAVNAGGEKNIGLTLSKDIEARYREEEIIKIPFPWKHFNDVTDGGYEPGNVIIINGTHGGGKSTIAALMAVEAAKAGFDVVFYTLELKENYVGKKMDNLLTKIEMKNLKHNRRLVEEANALLKGRIIIKEYYPGRSSLDTLESHLNSIENEEEGINPKVVVIDYPELLKPKKIRKDSNEESTDTYTDIKGMAGERAVAIIAPSQVNRTGMKDSVIESSSTSGTITKQFIADFSFSSSRMRKDKLSKKARFHIIKSRLGEDGLTYDVNMDLGRGIIEITGIYDEDADVMTPEQEDDAKTRLKQKFLKLNKNSDDDVPF